MDYSVYQGRGTHKITGQRRPDTFLPNVDEWADGILCLEAENDPYTADEVLGGVQGIDNAPTQAVANRTVFLLKRMYELGVIIDSMQTALGPMLTTIKKLNIRRITPQEEPTFNYNYDYNAWMQYENTPAGDAAHATLPSQYHLSIAVEGGQYVENPTFMITDQTGRTVYIKTNGDSVFIQDASGWLDQLGVDDE